MVRRHKHFIALNPCLGLHFLFPILIIKAQLCISKSTYYFRWPNIIIEMIQPIISGAPILAIVGVIWNIWNVPRVIWSSSMFSSMFPKMTIILRTFLFVFFFIFLICMSELLIFNKTCNLVVTVKRNGWLFRVIGCIDGNGTSSCRPIQHP